MAGYFFKHPGDEDDEDNQSCYESDREQTVYFPESSDYLGTGSQCFAREFRSASGKSLAVLSPVPEKRVNATEARTKLAFFRKLYPKELVDFHYRENIQGLTYRLILPLVKGTPYNSLVCPISKKEQVDLFLSALNALEEAHKARIILLDLKSNNIHFDEETGISYLLDGGLSQETGSVLTTSFLVRNLEDMQKKKEDFSYIAPECWYLSGQKIKAAPEMDIFSLGCMMKKILDQPCEGISQLIKDCMQESPQKRPSSYQLKEGLKALLSSPSDDPIFDRPAKKNKPDNSFFESPMAKTTSEPKSDNFFSPMEEDSKDLASPRV